LSEYASHKSWVDVQVYMISDKHGNKQHYS